MTNELLVRNSVYENVFIAAQNRNFIREDDRLQYKLHLYLVPFTDFETGIRFTYTDNDSNDPNEVFDRKVTQAYLNWYF